MIDTAPYSFNPHFRKRRGSPPVVERGLTLDAPPTSAPDCPLSERDESIAALHAMQAARPLKPPGRR